MDLGITQQGWCTWPDLEHALFTRSLRLEGAQRMWVEDQGGGTGGGGGVGSKEYASLLYTRLSMQPEYQVG
jgi:hypothetical protein